MPPISVSIVSYFNTIPIVYGLENYLPQGIVSLHKCVPALCASKLFSGEVEMGLIPVGALVNLENYNIVSNYCIGAEGNVATVELFSQCKLEEIENIYLDPNSRTSNLLVKILAEKKWKINPRWLQPEVGYENKIKGTTAGVMIGNRVFDHKDSYNYCIDLAESWIELTGLPFVFACFASLKRMDELFILKFDQAIRQGIENTDKAIASHHIDFKFDIKEYLTKNIKFEFDDKKRAAMNLFHEYCRSLNNMDIS